ncbi:MAG: hypothetical protein OXE73_04250 [Gammaproteobacteria bacterium]|nr:hypothetical protein [Gammaproteobacteria bacterium]
MTAKPCRADRPPGSVAVTVIVARVPVAMALIETIPPVIVAETAAGFELAAS